MVGAIPCHKALDAYLDRRVRFEADIADKVIHIRIGGRHIAGLQGEQVLFGFPAELLFEHLYKLQQLHRLVVADVINLIWRAACARIRGIAGPAGVGAGRLVHHPHDSLDNIINIRKVPLHLPKVEHIDRPAFEDRPREQKQGHIGTAPWTIDGKKAKAGSWNIIQVAVGMGYQFICLLCRGIQTDGVIHIVMR